MNHSKIKPPKLADRFFKWYCRNELRESILGDLHERFYEDIKSKGRFLARLYYWFNVFRFLNRFTLRNHPDRRYHSLNFNAMLKNYLRISFRNLKRNVTYSAINILGLAIGLASCMIISLFVSKELSFDTFHTRSNRIYKVTNIMERASGILNWARTPPALAPAIRQNFPGIEKVTRLRYADDHTYSVGDKIFVQGNVFYADSLFLEIFDFPLKSGNPQIALDEPGSIVISEEMAAKYFGQNNPLGQLITFDNERSLKVTGVLEPIPANSHISFDMLISFSTFIVPEGYLADLNSWGWAGFHTYIQTTPNVNIPNLEENIRKLYSENFTNANIDVSVELQLLTSIYLGSEKYTNIGESIRIGSKPTIYGLSMVALLILVLAGFNFVNLTTAMSLSRGKEIGIRKVMGAMKGKIITQFLTEATVIGLIGLTIAFCLILLSQPYFRSYLNIDLPASIIGYVGVIPLFVFLTILFGTLAGIYPATVFSSINMIKALRGNLSTGKSGTAFRNVLIVLQFTISLSLIIASIVIRSQMNFIQNKALGFDKENVLKLRISRHDMADKYTELKGNLLQHSQIVAVSRANHAFDGSASQGPARLPATADEAYQLSYYQAGFDFLEVTGLNLIDGRYFSRDFPNDVTQALVLNEEAVEMLELADPVGQKIHFNNIDKTVIGVVEDFHFASLHSPIAPMGLVMPFTNGELIVIRTTPGNLSEVLQILESEWKQVIGSAPIDITFLDDGIQKMYETEQNLSQLINLFTVLAVLLACLGLYGLVAFSVHSRLKEVGIRKVLGASILRIVAILTRQFLLLISIANLIAWPVAYYFGNIWLQNFAYRINMQWWMFVASGLVILIFALITIGNKTARAAMTNPVKILRNE